MPAGRKSANVKPSRGRKPGQKTAITGSQRAGTIFPPSRCNRLMR